MHSAENARVIQETQTLQAQTSEALDRIRSQLATTTEVAGQVCTRMDGQDEQITRVHKSLDELHASLDRASGLLNRFDRWALRTSHTQVPNKNTIPVSPDVLYENQRYDPIKAVWREPFLPTDPSPVTYANGSPASETVSNFRWIVDIVGDGPDLDGWNYAFDFPNLSDEQAFASGSHRWVRRRRWICKHDDCSVILQHMSAKYSSKAPTRRETIPGTRVERRILCQVDNNLTRTAMVRRRLPPGSLSQLTAAEQAQVEQIQKTDADMNNTITEIDNIVEELGEQSAAISAKLKAQAPSIDVMASRIDEAQTRLGPINSRVRNQIHHV